MFVSDVSLRVRYADTDQMGYVYYGRYAEYFEVARVEALRMLGVSYQALEASGIMMPVVEYHTKYHKPARYDELLNIQVAIPELPSIRIRFNYLVTSESNGELINEAHTTLVFIHAESKKIQRIPKLLEDALKPFFS